MNTGVTTLMKHGYTEDEAYEIRREYIRLTRLAFPEQDRAIKKAWILRNPEKHLDGCRRKQRRWRENNREHANSLARKSMALWRQRHPTTWRIKNADNSRRWRKRYPGKVSAKTRRYRAVKLNLCPKGTETDLDAIRKIYERSQWWRSRGFDVSVDHIVPMHRGGLHNIKNLQIIYGTENSAKGYRLDYRPRIVFL